MNPQMAYSGNGLALTERFEGFRAKAYQDATGTWTCGYGHTQGVTGGTTCDQQLAEQWLLSDIRVAVDAVNRMVTVPLTQDEFDAIVDFVFNVGQGNFGASTMLELLNQGEYQAAAEQFSRWDFINGQAVAGLLNRRVAEQTLFNSQPPEQEA